MIESQAQALRRAVSQFQRALRNSRDADGPSPAQLSVLGTLYRLGRMTAGDLARRERLKPQSITRLLSAVVAGGFAERIVDDTDRRRSVIAITAKGRDALFAEMRHRDHHLARALKKLSTGERATIAAACPLLERLAKATLG